MCISNTKQEGLTSTSSLTSLSIPPLTKGNGTWEDHRSSKPHRISTATLLPREHHKETSGSRRSSTLQCQTIGGTDFHVVPHFPLNTTPYQGKQNGEDHSSSNPLRISTATQLPREHHEETSGSRRSSTLRIQMVGGTDFHVVPHFPLNTTPHQGKQSVGRPQFIDPPPYFHSNPIATRTSPGNKWVETELDPPISNNRRDRLPRRPSFPPQYHPLQRKTERGKTMVLRSPSAFPQQPCCHANITRKQVVRDGAQPSEFKQSEGLTSTSSLISPSIPRLTKRNGTREDHGSSNPLRISTATQLPREHHEETSGSRRSSTLHCDKMGGTDPSMFFSIPTPIIHLNNHFELLFLILA